MQTQETMIKQGQTEPENVVTTEPKKQTEAQNAVTTFEGVERRLDELYKRALALDSEYVTLRDQAEKIVRDIGAANAEAETELENYRSAFDDGEKAEADGAFSRVSEQRAAVKNLRKSLGELLPRLAEIQRQCEAVRVCGCDECQPEFVADFRRRLEAVSVSPSRIMDAADHTSVALEKLCGYIRKNCL